MGHSAPLHLELRVVTAAGMSHHHHCASCRLSTTRLNILMKTKNCWGQYKDGQFSSPCLKFLRVLLLCFNTPGHQKLITEYIMFNCGLKLA